MAFTRKSFEKMWTNPEDFPAYQDSEEKVRADMQYHPNALLGFLSSLQNELEAKSAAGSLGALNAAGAADTVQSVLDNHNSELGRLSESIRDLAAGDAPDLVRSAEVEFFEESWIESGGKMSLTIDKADHKRGSAAFGYNLYQKVDGDYLGGTWGTAATRAVYNADESITLITDTPYEGKAVFFGM